MKKIILFLAIFTIGIYGKHVKSNDHAEVVWETEKIFELPESEVAHAFEIFELCF